MGLSRTALFVRRSVGGLFAVEDMATTTGARIFCDYTTGTDAGGYGTGPDKPVKTLNYAITLCTANKGDIIYLMPGHAETLAATITPAAGSSIVGLGRGGARPKITGLTAIAMLTISAANVTVRNVHFLAVTGTTYIAHISAAAPILENCIFEQVAVPVKAIKIRGLTAGTEAVFRGCTFIGKVNGPAYAIDFASSSGDNWIVDSCTFNYAAAGLDTAAIRANHKQSGYVITNCLFMGIDLYLVEFLSSVGAMPDGVMTDCRVFTTAILASTEDVLDASKGLACANVLATDDKTKWAVPIATAQVSAS